MGKMQYSSGLILRNALTLQNATIHLVSSSANNAHLPVRRLHLAITGRRHHTPEMHRHGDISGKLNTAACEGQATHAAQQIPH